MNIGIIGLVMLTASIMVAFFGNFMTGGEPWNDPSSSFDIYGLYENIWVLVLIIISVFLATSYFPAISGRLGDSSSIGLEVERHGSTMSIQQTILSISEIIGIVAGGLALVVVFSISGVEDNFAYNIVGLLVPIVILLIFTSIATILWPAEEDFIKQAKVRRRRKT